MAGPTIRRIQLRTMWSPTLKLRYLFTTSH
uniref:Uncharacterized protein n=1 Tax=Rhizophora mucronata TaxID=61149 RepID=A0A2P2R1X2_RHIMU